jgi:hypothetical protein
MKSILKGVALSAVAAAVMAMPAQSQTGRFGLGIHGAVMHPADQANGPNTYLGFDEKPGLGGSLNLWLGETRRWGLLTNGTWSKWGRFEAGTTALNPFPNKEVTMAMGDLSLAFRPITPSGSSRFLPYLSLGLGALHINPHNTTPFTSDTSICANGGGSTCDFTAANVRLDQSKHTDWAGVGAVGTDFFFTPSVALRLEAKDYYTDEAAYKRLTTGTFHNGDHNLLFTGGLAFYMGGSGVSEPGFVREEPIIVTPPPAAPAPAPAPAPVVTTPAPPAEESVTMCIVDPSNLQARTISATRVISDNTVYVNQNGQRVLFENAYPASSPIYVRGATWYMNDQPLVVDLEPATSKVTAADRNRLELVLFGSPMQRTATDLVFMGTINGTPVYASRTDVVSLQPRLEGHFSTSKDLATILREDATLAKDMGAVSTYYVAVEPNCVFQPVSVTHFVRRTRG